MSIVEHTLVFSWSAHWPDCAINESPDSKIHSTLPVDGSPVRTQSCRSEMGLSKWVLHLTAPSATSPYQGGIKYAA